MTDDTNEEFYKDLVSVLLDEIKVLNYRVDTLTKENSLLSSHVPSEDQDRIIDELNSWQSIKQ